MMDAALLDFWSFEVSLTRNVPSSPEDDFSPLIVAPSLQVPMESLTDSVPSTCVTTCDHKICNSTGIALFLQDTSVDGDCLNGEKAMVLYSAPPRIVPSALPPPQPPPSYPSMLEQ